MLIESLNSMISLANIVLTSLQFEDIDVDHVVATCSKRLNKSEFLTKIPVLSVFRVVSGMYEVVLASVVVKTALFKDRM